MTATQTQLRRDTATNLSAATPAAGEPGWDTTNKRLVIGDGTTAGGIKVAMAKDQQNQTFTAGTVGGTGDAITLTNSPVVAAYAVNQKFSFKAASANTGAVTLDVDSLGAKSVKKMNNGALAALAANDIISGGMYDVFYDGTQFQIKAIAEGPYSSGALVYLGTVTASGSANAALTSLISSTYDDYVIVLSGVLPASSSVSLRLEASGTNGVSYLSSLYNYCSSNLAGTTQTNTNSGDVSIITMTATNIYNNGNYGDVAGEVRLYNVNNAGASQSMIKWDLAYNVDNAGAMAMSRGMAVARRGTAEAINAVRFTMSSGNISAGKFRIYGIAKS